jgi:hypothetical protein
VYVTDESAASAATIPAELEGWPVVVRESGGFRALAD